MSFIKNGFKNIYVKREVYMKYKIVVDSSSNLSNDYIKDPNIGFQVIPLTLRINNVDYVDNEKLDVKQMLSELNKTKIKPTSSCPSPQAFADSYADAENIIVITISSKLSGVFNSAFIGGMDINNHKVHVIDSKATAGNLILLADKAYELMKQDLEFEEICTKLEEYNKTLNLFFVLDKFDNLVRNGRMSKLVAFVATSLAIKPVCIAENGEIKVYKKLRTLKMALKGMVSEISNLVTGQDLSQKTCIVCAIEGEDVGPLVKKLIEEEYNFKEVRLVYNRGLCAFYALENGVIVSF